MEINSYKAQPAFLEPYKKGMELAVEQVNASGGIAGRKLQLIVRDDNANPGDAVRAAEELLAREKVDVLMGSFLARGPAVAEFCQAEEVSSAGEPLTDKMTPQGGNQYTFRLRPGTYMQAAAGARGRQEKCAAAGPWSTLRRIHGAVCRGGVQTAAQGRPARRGVRPNKPHHWPVTPHSVVQALSDAKPDAIFNVLMERS